MATLRLWTSAMQYKKFVFKMKVQSIIHFYTVFKNLLRKDREALMLLRVAIRAYRKRCDKMKKLIGVNEFQKLLTKEEESGIAEVLNAPLIC